MTALRAFLSGKGFGGKFRNTKRYTSLKQLRAERRIKGSHRRGLLETGLQELKPTSKGRNEKAKAEF